MSIEPKVTRKLRAILGVDITGYSRLMADGEECYLNSRNVGRWN